MRELLQPRNTPQKTCSLDPTRNLELFCTVVTQIIKFNDSLSTGIVPTSFKHAAVKLLLLSTGIEPTSFKHAAVKPLLKKATLSAEELRNFGPVLNLPSYLRSLNNTDPI